MMSCDSLRNSEPNMLLRTEVMASVCLLLLETALMAGISTISNASEPFRIQDPLVHLIALIMEAQLLEKRYEECS